MKILSVLIKMTKSYMFDIFYGQYMVHVCGGDLHKHHSYYESYYIPRLILQLWHCRVTTSFKESTQNNGLQEYYYISPSLHSSGVPLNAQI